MSSYTLTYFDFDGGRGEPIRIAFHAAGVAFEDKRLSFAQFAEQRAGFRFNALPVLEVDGVAVTQSNAIGRYVGKLAGLYPADDLQALFRQELAEQLPALEASVAARDLRRARGIAHRLLASSRLCGERRLELSLQAFHAACREGALAGDVARGYFGLLAGAGQYLGFVLRQSGSTASSPERPVPARRKSRGQ
jgi:glutathione S-transferase